jgi:hypothetical protein
MSRVRRPAPWFRAGLSHAQLRPIYPLGRQESIHGLVTFDGEAGVNEASKALERTRSTWSRSFHQVFTLFKVTDRCWLLIDYPRAWLPTS